jgi:YNFM family putative membrane transporter
MSFMMKLTETTASTATPIVPTLSQDLSTAQIRWVLLSLVLTALFVLTQLYLAIPLLPYLGQDFNSSNATITLALASSFSICYAMGFLIWGVISDQYGRRPVLLVGLMLLILTTIVCSLVSSLQALTVIRALQGLVASSFAPIALAWLAEAMPVQYRAKAVGAMSSAFLVAGIFGQVLAAWIALHWHWRLVFISTAICLAILFLALLWQVKETRQQLATNLKLLQRFGAIFSLALRRDIALLGLAHFSLLLSFVAMYAALGPHLAIFNLEPSTVLQLRLMAMPCMFVALLVAPLIQRFGLCKVAVIGFAMAAIGIALQASLASSLLAIVMGSMVFVTGVALAVPSMISLFAHLSAPNLGVGMALNGFILFAGATVGGLLVTRFNNFSLLMTGLASMLLLASVCVATSAILSRSWRT